MFSADQWNFGTSMIKPRGKLGAAVLDKKIYAAGGSDDGGRILNSVECFDPLSDSWSLVSSMNKPRQFHSLVTVNDVLYAVGGWVPHDEEDMELIYENSMEMYDPEDDKWTLLDVQIDGYVNLYTGAVAMRKSDLL